MSPYINQEILDECREEQKTIKTEEEYKNEKKFLRTLYIECWSRFSDGGFSKYEGGNISEPVYNMFHREWKYEIKAKREELARYIQENLISDDQNKKEKVETFWNEIKFCCRKKNTFTSLINFDISKGYVLKVVNAVEENRKLKHRESIPTEIKDKVDRRDNNKCVNCGKNNDLHYHHIIPHNEAQEHKKDNIALLCEDCHIKVHRTELYWNYSLNGTKQDFWNWTS